MWVRAYVLQAEHKIQSADGPLVLQLHKVRHEGSTSKKCGIIMIYTPAVAIPFVMACDGCDCEYLPKYIYHPSGLSMVQRFVLKAASNVTAMLLLCPGAQDAVCPAS